MFTISRNSLYWVSLYRGLSTSVVGIDTKDGSSVRNYILNPFFYRSYDWNYNLNRHLKYECGKENAFQCAKCGRKFPHKQNCVYHLKRKHKIVCDTIDQYMAQGLVVFRGGQGAGGQQVANPEWRFFFPDFFQIFFRIFSGFWQLLFWAARTWTNKKFATNFFQSKNHKKQYYYYAITYTYLLQIVQKIGWRKKEKRSCFDFFVMLRRVISWSAIYILSDCTVLHKIKRRKIVQ